MTSTKLTKLEMNELQNLADLLENIRTSQNKNLDSIQDFIFEQFEVSTDEPLTLNAVREHFDLANKKLEEAYLSMDLIIDHFTAGR